MLVLVAVFQNQHIAVSWQGCNTSLGLSLRSDDLDVYQGTSHVTDIHNVCLSHAMWGFQVYGMFS